MTSSLSEGRFRQAEFWRTIWTVNAEIDTTVDDMLVESYWSHVARYLKPWDRIEVRVEDGSLYAEFIVRDAGRTWAKVALLTEKSLEPDPLYAEGGTKDYIAKWTGRHTKWRVVRVKDKSTMKENFSTKEEALKYITEHEKTVNR